MNMKSKNKKVTFPLVMCLIFLTAAVVTLLFVIIPDNRLLFLFISMGLLALSFLFFLIHFLIRRKEYQEGEEDKKAIAKALDSIARDEDVALLNVSKDDEVIVNIAKKINNIYLDDNALAPNHIYKGEKFYEELNKLLRRHELVEYAYIRLTGVDKGVYNELVKPYARRYAHLAKDHLDVVICPPYERDALITEVSALIEAHKRMCAYIAFSNDHSLMEISQFMEERYKLTAPRMQIYEKEEKSFRSISHKYEEMDLAKNRILNDYLKEIYDYLPFSHIGIKYNDEYYRLCTLGTLRQIDQIPEEEFAYFKELPLFVFNDNRLSLVLANTEPLLLTGNDEENLSQFIRMIRLLMVHELGMDEYDALEHRYDRLEVLSHNLSYEVNDDYIITYASKRLEESFNHHLKGQLCYKALHGLDKPCKNCPLLKESNQNTFIVGSKRFSAKHSPNEENETIYLLNEEKPYLPNKKDLSIKLLNLINNYSKGYLLVVKLDNLLSNANRLKVEVEDIVKQIIETLTVYGLSENLYRKDKDEFVYILEDATVADSIRIAKEVSRAFLEKFNAGDSEITLVPKIVMLSYPLEVNTLFSLDALCRRMFSSITDKGRLHRLDENPIPIDNHRYYIEIVENSYKSGKLPIVYEPVKDENNKLSMKYLFLRYKDENGHDIPEDEITLYTKIDKTYPVLVDKVVRAIKFENNSDTVILPIGKDGIDLKIMEPLMAHLINKKIDPSRLIFEIKEKDAFNFAKEVKDLQNMGFNFAITIKDNLIYNINVLEYRYIKIDGERLSKDKLYQVKINDILNAGVPMMISEKYQGLLNNVKYICK